MRLTDPSNDQLVKDEGAQIFYSIWSQTKPIGIGANCENPSQSLPHNAAPTTRTYTTCRTVCLTDPSNDQLVKDEGAQIFYSIRSQTKLIGIGTNCENPSQKHIPIKHLGGIQTLMHFSMQHKDHFCLTIYILFNSILNRKNQLTCLTIL